MQVFDSFNPTAASIIADGGVGVIRTDTLYGIIARADNQSAVDRVFEIKQRTPTKSPIVLMSSVDQLYDDYTRTTYDYLNSRWPGPYSIILPSSAPYDWLTRGNQSIAYRLPDYPALQDFIDESGPIIAPSANPEGLAPANNIDEAISYFGEQVDFYIDSGEVSPDQPPSQLWRYDVDSGSAERLR